MERKRINYGFGRFYFFALFGIWRDSSQAVWQIIQKGENELLVSGDWPYIPVTQIWEIKLIDENSILWRIEMEIYEEADLELIQANLMLINGYYDWEAVGIIKGRFCDEFTHGYDILPYRYWYGKPQQNGIMVIDKTFPDIVFRPDMEDDSLRAIVENTDYLYQARLLQYQKSNIGKLSPQKYCFFAGIIEIKPHD